MDKFGIFNLLNSFLNFSGKSTNETAHSNDDKDSNSGDFLSSLLNGLKNSENKPDIPTSSNQNSTLKPSPTTPLQKQMLSTMSMHDQLIKRVNDKLKS